VTWIDNFSKQYHLNVPSFRRGEYANSLWTGVGHHLPMFDVPHALDLLINASGDIEDAMPPDLFDEGLVEHTLNWLAQLNRPGEEHNMFDSSVYRALDIQSVPIKIRLDLVPDPNDPLLANYDPRSVSLDNFIPASIDPWNVGSNDGLAMVVKRELDAVMVDGECSPTKYRMIFADVNIFERLLKVCTKSHECL
jgi:hypothetical protein